MRKQKKKQNIACSVLEKKNKNKKKHSMRCFISYKLLWLVVYELQLECPPLGSSLGHCAIYMWAAAPETEDRYTVSHMVTP